MSPHDAENLVGYLAGVTNGWDDASANLYADEFERWEDPAALKSAIDGVLVNATNTYRPALGKIREAYLAERRRRDSIATGELPPAPDRFPTFEEGVEIAKAAYHAECYRRGTESNDTHFARWLRLSKEERRAQAAEFGRRTASRGLSRR